MEDDLAVNRRFIEITLKTALGKNATDRQISQVPKLLDKLDNFDLSDEANKGISDLILECFSSVNILKKAKLRKFLNQTFHKIFYRISDLAEIYEKTLRECKEAVSESIGEICVNAWMNLDETERKLFEIHLVKPIAEWAIRAETPAFHKNCRVILEKFKDQRSKKSGKKEISQALAHIYEPIIFRYLHTANPLVRDNAIDIFSLCAFPLTSPAFTTEKNDRMLEASVDEMKMILKDDCPKIRASAAKCVCRILYEWWDAFKTTSVSAKQFVDIITKDCCFDVAYKVRDAALQGLNFLCGHMHGLDAVSISLPDIAELLHDPNESVRISFIKLLTTISTHSEFSIFNIIHLDHFIYRLKCDSPKVIAEIVELLKPSMFDIQVRKKRRAENSEEEDQTESKQKQKENKMKTKINKIRAARCIYMCHRNLQAAENFYGSLAKTTAIDELLNFCHLLSFWSIENINYKLNPNMKKPIKIPVAQSNAMDTPPLLPPFDTEDDLVRLYRKEQALIRKIQRNEFQDDSDDEDSKPKKKKGKKQTKKNTEEGQNKNSEEEEADETNKEKKGDEEEDKEENKEEEENNEEEEKAQEEEEAAEEEVNGTIEEYQAVWAIISSIMCTIRKYITKDSINEFERFRNSIFHNYNIQTVMDNLPHVLHGPFFNLLGAFPAKDSTVRLTLDYISAGGCVAWPEALSCLMSWNVLGNFLKTQTDEIHFALTNEHLIPHEDAKEQEKEEVKEDDGEQIQNAYPPHEETRSDRLTKSLRYLIFMFDKTELSSKIDSDTDTIGALLTELNQFLPMMYCKLGLTPDSSEDELSLEVIEIASELSESCYINAIKLLVILRTHLAIKLLNFAIETDGDDSEFRTIITQISDNVFQPLISDLTKNFVDAGQVGPDSFQFKILDTVLTLSADMIRYHLFDDELYTKTVDSFKSFASNVDLVGHELRSIAFRCLATVAYNLSEDAQQNEETEMHPAQELLEYLSRFASDDDTFEIVKDLLEALVKLESKGILPWLQGELDQLSKDDVVKDTVKTYINTSLSKLLPQDQ